MPVPVCYVQPGAMKLVPWRHYMHRYMHPVMSENQFHCTRLYHLRTPSTPSGIKHNTGSPESDILQVLRKLQEMLLMKTTYSCDIPADIVTTTHNRPLLVSKNIQCCSKLMNILTLQRTHMIPLSDRQKMVPGSAGTSAGISWSINVTSCRNTRTPSQKELSANWKTNQNRHQYETVRAIVLDIIAIANQEARDTRRVFRKAIATCFKPMRTTNGHQPISTSRICLKIRKNTGHHFEEEAQLVTIGNGTV